MFSRTTTKCFRNTIPATAKEVLLQTKCNICPWKRFESIDLKHTIQEALTSSKEAIAKLQKEHDDATIGNIKLNNVLGGMHGLHLLIYESSLVNHATGITFRCHAIPELRELLPKNGEEPLPEGLFWLLCTGKVPNDDEVIWMTKEWNERSEVPEHVYEMVMNFPKRLHPMSKLSAALTAMNIGSHLNKALDAKEKASKLWEYMYEDVMNLLAKITNVAAVIYTSSFKECTIKPAIGKDKDWTENFCLNMGYKDKHFIDFMRLYLVLHSDHEGGNVTAHTAHLVHSALSDAYLALAAGVNGLAGPLDGLANQEVIKFIKEVEKELGATPSDSQLEEFCEKKLEHGVIPGYGHAVLRKTDPRFTTFKEFAEKNIQDDKMVNIVWQLFKVVPPLLEKTGKVKNPWPNVHAHSGCILHHYGMKEMGFYTVLFAVSRAMGVLSWLIWARGLDLPMERPRSITTEEIKKMFPSEDKKT